MDIYEVHITTLVKNVILHYLSTTQVMVDSHFEILWAKNSGEGLGWHPTENYGAGIYDPEK